MSVFAKLFKKETVIAPDRETMVVDCNFAGVSINGRAITLPAKLSDLAFLGEARKVKTKAGVNYAWDDLGMYCYTRKDGKMIHCIGIFLKESELFHTETTPKRTFGGRVTVGDKAWREVMDQGEKTEVYSKVVQGRYSIVAEYTAFMDSSDYGVLEISEK